MDPLDETFVARSRAIAATVSVAQRIYRAITAVVKRFDLTESQYNALRVLRGADRRSEQLTQAELAERLIASRANTTWILDRLEERRLIVRKGHADRRKNLVAITSAGQKLLAKIDPEFSAMLQRVLGNLSPEDLAALSALYSRFNFD